MKKLLPAIYRGKGNEEWGCDGGDVAGKRGKWNSSKSMKDLNSKREPAVRRNL